MITVEIANEQRIINFRSDIDETWITHAINRRKNDLLKVCVRVTIDQEDAHLTLITPTCPSGGRGGQLNEKETEMFELWKKKGLDKADFNSGSVVSFLKTLHAI